ncbi:diguanylate cyclase [Anoxybacterium hadale]|uniref:Diguanylate cyclase n=1 Tax=Anoxybacterium hadale TaxID=3408580 RepID=A0ACD1AEN2_9FIRM|nr:diguanylate cyclase [Clostridiales bacterium]
MELNNLLSALSLVAVYAYLHIGVFALLKNRNSIINKVFFALCIAYAIWSFAYSFAYLADTPRDFSLWNKVAAFGWCSFSAFTLYLVLLLTENRFSSRYIIFFLFLPSAIFLLMALFLFGPEMDTPPLISGIFYIGDFIYNFVYTALCIYLLARWGNRSDSLRVKKQARILVLSGLIPFSLNLLTQTILPFFGFKGLPLMGQIYAVFMVLGTYLVITKYKLMRITGNIILDEVENKIIELVILLNDKGEFIQVSKHVLKLLGFEESELLGKQISILFREEDRDRVTLETLRQENEYEDVQICTRSGETIPVHIMSVPINDQALNEFLGVLLIVRDIRKEYELRAINAELHERTIRDSLTNLYNHQHSLELLTAEINKHRQNPEAGMLSIMMLDIDHFKKINDTHGHLYGDYIIRTVSDIMRKNVGCRGYVGRFGGEEFIIILPDTELSDACTIGEEIRREVYRYSYTEQMPVTVSIGVSQLQDETAMQLLKKADDLLYIAKQGGRNRVKCE